MEDCIVMPKSDWQDVLDSIREKTGKSDLLLSGEVASEIRSISIGEGGFTPLGTKRITENGSHDVTEYATAEVDVETPTEELSVTANGEYTPSEGKHFSKVTVNVESSGSGSSGGESSGSDIPSGTGTMTLDVNLSVSNASDYAKTETIGYSVNSDSDVYYFDVEHDEMGLASFTINNIGDGDTIKIYIPIPSPSGEVYDDTTGDPSYSLDYVEDSDVMVFTITEMYASSYIYIVTDYHE